MDSSLLIVVLALVNVALLMLLLRRSSASSDLATPLQHLAQAVQQTQAQAAVLAERLEPLRPLAPAVQELQVELRGLGERILSVEREQRQASQTLAGLGTSLASTGADTKSLLDTAAAIRSELSAAQQALATLRSQTEAGLAVEQRTAESIRRLEMIIAGTQAKGAAGENILEVVFAKLPPEWQVRNFRVGNRVVEFGLRLPNNLVLPIDSKWPATTLVEQLAASDDPDERQRLKQQIERVVLEKAREVAKYLNPALTVNFAVAVLPDAVYDLCAGVHADVFQLNVVLVGHSMFVPYLLLVFQMVLRTSQNVDLEKLQQYLDAVAKSADALQEELEGRFSRALKMLDNAHGDMRGHVSRIRDSLTGMQLSAAGGVAALPAGAVGPGLSPLLATSATSGELPAP